ncbi:tetratricopeptide repeat protein [Algoriphagus marinus]|uniref:tetratricopeptide repeat protein n=1 Tax=Algoriphagus marinus TaxID=1925762 RepID=UPI00094B977B|nr:tetratricopeptide repeat protein [Algoriphagus marinus]
MKRLLVIHPVRTKLILLFVFAFSVLFFETLEAQTIESLKEELTRLSDKPGYAKDTVYLNKANELGFMLAESNPDSAILFLDQQILRCQEANYKKGESEALKIYGNALQNKGEFVESIEYYTNSLTIAKSLSDEKLVPGILNNIGLVYYNLGNYTEALHNFFDAIKGAETTGNLNVKAAALNNVALIYFEQEKFEEAKSKYKEMLSIYQGIGNQGRVILAYNNIGDVELKQNNPVAALENLKIGYASALDLQSPEFIEMTARTMADIYAAMDSTELAEELYRRSIAIAEEKGYGVPYSHSLIGLAELYYKNQNFEEASIYANKGLEQAEKMGQTTQLRNANELLAKINEVMGNYQAALDNYKLFKLYNDSINTSLGQRLATSLEAEYEFSKKTLEFEKAAIRQQWLTFSAFVGLFTFLIILFLVYRNRNRLDKAYQTLKEKNNEIKSKNEELENTLAQLKLIQLQLVQSEKMASLGELTAGISHQLQNPLNFVNNFSEVTAELVDEMKDELQKGDAKTALGVVDDVKSNLGKINKYGHLASGIIMNMLQHSRINTGQKEFTDLNALAIQYLNLSFHGIKAKDKDFVSEFSHTLDPNLKKIEIIPQEIGRVLLNLINNAFYAVNERLKSNPNSYHPQVNVTTKWLGDAVEIRVSDNGNGVPEPIRDKIFQPFFTTKPTGQGTGLGLSLSYDIVKAHGGELSMITREGQGESGSEFIIKLPIN